MSVQHRALPNINFPKPKVCIAVPARDMVYTHFAYCLQELVQYHAMRGIDTFVEFNMGTLVCNQREALASKAIDQGATHILWLDSDMMFPKTVGEVLLNHNYSVVACNYSTRALPFKPVAYTKMNDWNSGIPENSTGIIQVAGVGMGCMMTHVEVFGDMYKPWFPITFEASTNDYLGEDMNFCLQLRAADYSIYIDCDLSQQIYHIGSAAYNWNKKTVDT
jgi:hypothetical protein